MTGAGIPVTFSPQFKNVMSPSFSSVLKFHLAPQNDTGTDCPQTNTARKDLEEPLKYDFKKRFNP